MGSKRGSAIITSIVFTGVLAAAAATLISFTVTERRLNYRHELRLKSKNTAEAIVEYGFAQLKHKFETRTTFAANALQPGTADALFLPNVNQLDPDVDGSSLQLVGGTIPSSSSSLTYIDPNDPDNEFDPLKGKFVRAREISIYGKASVLDRMNGPPVTTYATQRLQVRDTPLFSHAIFYNLDLDIHPGPFMAIYGPVHANGSIRLNSYGGMYFYDQVTSADHLYHAYEHKTSKYWNHIKFPDRDGTLVSMKNDGVFLDSKMGTGSLQDSFRSYASNRWHGNLQTSMHGIETYNPVAFSDYHADDPTTTAYDPVNSGRAIIEPPLASSHSEYNEALEEQKIANQAGLYFKWDIMTSTLKAYKKDGTEVDISNLSGSLWTHLPGALRDRRRGADITTINIHTGKLKQLIESPDYSDPTKNISGYNPSTDWNGIVYFESYSTSSSEYYNKYFAYTGVRLLGGQTNVSGEGIPSRGLDPGMTFATNNVLYVQGHFNSDGSMSSNSSYQPDTGEVPVAIMGDAVTFLSANYTDSLNMSYGSVYRREGREPPAVSTEVSAAVVSGIRPPNVQGDNTYSGGAHNFPRFLESWTGDTFYIRGSMVCLYECEVDWSTWSTSYYDPPNRGYGFNNLFRDGYYPPGTPLIRTYRRLDFTTMSETEFNAELSALPW